ncbi:hypothetical protein ILUMI_00203 [Ignelater luminosus]|uniref:Rhabdoid tumor deletion region protein 1 n=1 Tax=Ignelater luminosus TaxID=2038154 RepID=A0A8K0DM30_IGNLU|nr:hypothetical protein ILUMI_00203 [Ignelater luminosus]
MYSPHKHSYLQSRSQGINPRIINRSVNLARNQPTIESSDFEPPWNRLTSEQPCIPIDNIDVTKRPVAFGRWALPKLRRELHDPDTDVVLQAITSISDLVHDPEKGYEAITLRIPDRMADLLAHNNPTIRERACMALTTIAGLSDGRDAIVKNHVSLTNIARLVEDAIDAVRIKAAALLEMISRNWMASDYLIEAGFIPLLLDNVYKEKEEIVGLHLETLCSLMYGEGKTDALQLGAFEIFLRLIEKGSNAIRSRAAYCLMMVTSTYNGKEMAYDASILPRLNVLLHEEDKEIYSSAAAAIMFCTTKSRAKLRAREIPHLPDRLVALTNHWHYPPAQLFSIKALTNICEHPEIRKEVGEKYLQRLENIVVGNNEDLKKHKEILLSVINWVPWSNT